MVESLLDDVPGLGEVRRKTLLKHFGSLKKLRAATVEEIAMVPGIGTRTATAIKDAVAQTAANGKTGARATPASTRPPARSRRCLIDSDRAHRGELVVVTGMTGAGRSTAAKELEDLGFYVVDNLPPSAAARRGRGSSTRAAGTEPADRRRGRRPLRVVLRTRSRPTSPSGATGRRTTLLFLEATDDVLVRRQEAARRPHPLQAGGRLLDGLQREREVLADLRGEADLVIDTTDLNVHQLTDRIAEAFGTPDATRLKVTVISFGFKYGIPVDADFVADMRFLPNPFWVPELRPQHRPRRRRRRLRPRPARARRVPRRLRPGARGASPRATSARASAS